MLRCAISRNPATPSSFSLGLPASSRSSRLQLAVGIGALDPLEFCDQGGLMPLDRLRGAGALGQETGKVVRVVDELLAGGTARPEDGQKLFPSCAESLVECQDA